MNNFPDDVLAHLFDFVTSHRDRNAVSLVCKLWCRIEGFNRERVFVGNGDAISPERVIERFPRLKSLTLKGKPHFAELNFEPHDFQPWIEALTKREIGLEELRLKRLLVSDESLELVSRSFANFKSLVLVSCEGFTTHGLEAIAANCRFLRELDLQGNEIDDLSGHWLSCFTESCTSLTSLNFACLKGEINLVALESLVARSPNLKSLKLNRAVPPDMLQKILMQAPQLVDLGIGSLARFSNTETFEKLKTAFQNCKSIRNLSGIFEISLCLFLRPIRPILFNLTSLNLCCVPSRIYGTELEIMISLCVKLQRLWVLDLIGDEGLEVVASNCKELQELRVFPSDPSGDGDGAVTEMGLVAISSGCPKLHSLLYFCGQMTNAGLETIAKNCPNLIRFRLCIFDPKKPDPVTMQPLDEGFGAIVRSCKRLRRLSLSGLVTDQVFVYIGMYAEQLEMLSIAFARGTDKGMLNVLNGCKKLRKLEIKDSPFGDVALLNVGKCETLRSLWMSSCEVTVGGCDVLGEETPSLNVEMDVDIDILKIDELGGVELEDGQKVEKMYLYRTLDWLRNDAPESVWTS